MHRLPVGKEYHAEIPLFLLDEGPTLNAAVGLQFFRERRPDSELDPSVEDPRSVWSAARETKVGRGFQVERSTQAFVRRLPSTRRRRLLTRLASAFLP